MLRGFAKVLFRYRGVLLFGYVLLTGLFLYYATRLEVTTTFSDLLPYTHPYVKVFQKYGDTFGSQLTVYVVLEVKEGDIFHPETLRKVQRITQGLDAIPGINHNQVISITSPRVKRVEAVGGAVETTALIGPVLPRSAQEMKDLRERVETNEGVRGVLVSFDSKATLMTANFLERLVNYRTVFEEVTEIIRRERDAHHSLYAAGQPMLAGWVYSHQAEMFAIFGAGLLTVTALLGFYFRSLAGIIVPLLVGGVSTIWGLGFLGLLGYRLDPLIIVVPVLLVARALSHSVQVCRRYMEVYREVRDVHQASREALIALFPAGVVGIITDAAGLFIIALTSIRLIERVGYLCGLWALSFIFSVVVLTPVILSYLPAPRNIEGALMADRKRGVLSWIFRFIALFSFNRRGAIGTVIFFVGIGLLSGWFTFKREVGDTGSGSPLLWPGSFYNLSVEKLNQYFVGADELHIILEGQRTDTIKQPRVLKTMLELQSHMEQSPGVMGTLSIADYITKISKYLNSGLPKWEIIPDDRRWTGSLYQVILAGSNPGDWDRFFTPDYMNANIIVWCKDHRADTVRQVMETAREFVDAHNASLEGPKFILASGAIGLVAATHETLQHSELQTVILISLAIFGITSFAYRSFTAGWLLAIIANLANLMTGAVMYALGIGLDVNTLPIACVGMGVGIDYNIYLMSRMAEEYQKEPAYERLIPVSLFTTGQAIFFTAITMVVSIVPWYFLSSLRFQAEMGLLLGAIMCAHLALALFFQPAMMRLLQPKFIARKLRINERRFGELLRRGGPYG